MSQARAMRSALVKRLYCAARAVFTGVLSTPPVGFLEFFPGNRNHHHCSDVVGCHELQSFAIAKSAAAKLKMKMLPTGFSVTLCNTAIESCDRHNNRSFLRLRIADFVVDAVDVVDVSVPEIGRFPPGEHLAFSGIVFNASAKSCRCRRELYNHVVQERYDRKA